MRIVLAGLQQAIRDWESDQAGQCEDEDGEELGLKVWVSAYGEWAWQSIPIVLCE
jgi:hypothetical protein